MENIIFTVKADSGISGYWIAVDDKDVQLINGVGEIMLAKGEHILAWWMVGNSGNGISITGRRSNGQEVVSVKKSKIPQGHTQAGGVKRFIV